MKMEKKLIIVTLLLLSLFMIGAVSAASNTTETNINDMEVEKLSASNDVNAMDELNEDDTGSDDVLQRDAKSAAACEKEINAMDELNEDDTGSDDVLQRDAKSAAAGEKEILSVGDSDSDVLGAK